MFSLPFFFFLCHSLPLPNLSPHLAQMQQGAAFGVRRVGLAAAVFRRHASSDFAAKRPLETLLVCPLTKKPMQYVVEEGMGEDASGVAGGQGSM